MNKKLEELQKNNNGYLLFSDALKIGLSKQSIMNYIKSNNFIKVSKGLYLSNDGWVDSMYQLSIKNPKVIISHETALFLHSLMEHEPKYLEATIRQGYNASHLRKQGVKVYSVINDYYGIGVVKKMTMFGNYVNCYDMERTICDIIKNKKNMDIQTYNYALKEYVRSKDKNIVILMEYARKLGVYEKVRSIMELLL